MKIFAVLLLSLVCIFGVQAQIKAPYLPSGWKPNGPAFELPSEVQVPCLAYQAKTFGDTNDITVSDVTQTETDISSTNDQTSAISVGRDIESRTIDEAGNQIVIFENQDVNEVVEFDSVTENSEQVTEGIEQVSNEPAIQPRSEGDVDTATEVIQNFDKEEVTSTTEGIVDETYFRTIEEEQTDDIVASGFTEYGPPAVDISASAAEQIPVAFSEYGPPKEIESIQLLEDARLRRFAPIYRSTLSKH